MQPRLQMPYGLRAALCTMPTNSAIAPDLRCEPRRARQAASDDVQAIGPYTQNPALRSAPTRRACLLTQPYPVNLGRALRARTLTNALAVGP